MLAEALPSSNATLDRPKTKGAAEGWFPQPRQTQRMVFD